VQVGFCIKSKEEDFITIVGFTGTISSLHNTIGYHVPITQNLT